MPLVLPFIGLLILLSLVLYELFERTDAWLRSLLVWVFKPRQSFWKKVVLWPLHKIATGILKVEHGVASALSHAFAYAIKPITRHYNGLAAIESYVATQTGYLAQQTHNALYYLRHTAIPRLIDNAVTPIRKTATQALQLAQTVTNWANRVENRVTGAFANLGIGVYATLDNALIGLGKAFVALHNEVWNVVLPKVNYITGTLVPQLTRDIATITHDLYETGINSIDGLRARVKSLEDLLSSTLGGLQDIIIAALGTVAGIAAIEAVLTKIAPELFCNNTRNTAKKLCSLDESLIASLLGGTLALLVALDVELIAEEAQTAYGAMEGIVREMAKV